MIWNQFYIESKQSSFKVLQKGWGDALRINVKMNSRTWCDCLLHGEFHSPDMKVSDKYVYVYLYFTNIYVFVCTGQNNIFWSITQLQNIGETCQVCNKKVQSFSHTMQCKNCLIIYKMHKCRQNRSAVWIVVLSILCPSYFSLQSFWWWRWLLFCSDWMYARLFFSIAWNQQQNFHPIWNQWQFWHPLGWYRSWLSVLYQFSSQW